MLRVIQKTHWGRFAFSPMQHPLPCLPPWPRGSGADPILHIIEPAKADTDAKKPKVSSSAKAKSTKRRSSSVREAGSREKYSSLIRKAAAKHGVPANIAKAVVEVESNFNPRARGRAGEVGLMQIKPATARGIGYRGSTKALYDPETNLEWGMKYLAGAHERANGDLCGYDPALQRRPLCQTDEPGQPPVLFQGQTHLGVQLNRLPT